MFHLKIKPILLFLTLLFLLSIPTSGILLLRFLPDYPVSIVLFKTVYSLPIGKRTFLQFYSPARERIRGYVPTRVNNFLIQRIETVNDENEISAIVHFYALQASEHRLGYLRNISDKAKLKVINQLIKQLDDESTLGGKLMMFEELRTGKSLGKGSVEIEGINYPDFSTREEYKKWFYERTLSIVIPRYEEWWNSNLSWEEKRKINPLKDTNIKVTECCG